ncbi:hypothetical protein [Halorubellus salinus]|uniref:hypothetical protein n=1 Tax=Halorubellus salinus TaxID=755309 RepID=UPI001D0791B9|nr:hypothetical protein [Halorubellus salinus]
MPSRRALLQAVAASAPALAPTGADSTRSDAVASPMTVGVAVHRVRSIPDRTFRRVVRAVDRGVEQVARNADRELDRDVEYDVVAGATAPRGTVVTNTRDAVYRSTANWLDATDRRDPDALHLMLVDAPLQQSIGYGGNRSHVKYDGPVSYANVGATERWDDAAVTDNMAVHEVLHGLVTPYDARPVIGRGCEHDLGAVIPAGDGRGAIVTPLATAYAETTVGGETQWPGSGCLGHFSQDVGYDPDWWGHTYALSPATLAATARYLGRI